MQILLPWLIEVENPTGEALQRKSTQTHFLNGKTYLLQNQKQKQTEKFDQFGVAL
jgi:hypothetical protein